MTADERALCDRCATGVGTLTAGLVAAAHRHRMHLLLASGLSAEERLTPAGVQLARELTVAGGLDAWQDEATRDLLDGLGEAGIATLLLKGAGLAHTVYPKPHLRPRTDVDLLIRRDALAATEQVLAARGWTHPPELERDMSAAQRHYVKQGPGALFFRADVHWKIANPRAFASVLTFDELESRALPLAPLGPFARTLSGADALLLACVHRVAHHGDALDLLWLWDIHLLVQRLSPVDLDSVVARAERTETQAVSARGLQLAGELFGSPAAVGLAARLEAARIADSRPPSSRFLGGARPVFVLRSDMGTLTWRERVRLVAEHLFPSAVYMRSRYPRWPAALLPLAYVDRIARGAPKWFRRDGGDT